jgi:hypothetical protein
VKQFNLDHHKWEDYRGTRFYNKDSAESALVMKRWVNRVEEDSSGLTLQEGTPDVDTSRTPNHSQFYLKIIETRPFGYFYFVLSCNPVYVRHVDSSTLAQF